jgi:hypothetical protein
MQLRLVRDSYGEDYTLGQLFVPGVLNPYQTLERPWLPSDVCRGGMTGISCVPESTYKLVRHNSLKHPQTWALVNDDMDVCHEPTAGKRSDVLIHPANYVSELEGCIALGMSRMYVHGQWAVISSRAAFDDIKKYVPWTDEHTLIIEGVNRG